MSSTNLQNQWASAYLTGGSEAYIDNLYEDYLHDPNSVSSDWQAVFAALPKIGDHEEISHRDIRTDFLAYRSKNEQKISLEEKKQYQVANLINSYRQHGHHAAKLDPLEMDKRLSVPGLELAYHQLTTADLDDVFFAGKYFSNTRMPLKEILQALHETYCGSIGIEYMHITNSNETDWLQQQMEEARGRPKLVAKQKLNILYSLIASDGLERYLGTRYVGQKRFSLEGGDALIPMIKEILTMAGDAKVNDLMIGMTHRGRLNLLVNVLGKSPNELFQEFEGKIKSELSGDVKYHLGYSSDLRTQNNFIVHVALAFNPSHLEIIGPVVEGGARSRLIRRHDLAEKNKVIPIIIHGDAAFAGQGVVMETFNFSQARGYSTGGTIHIVINNQIGFTTSNPLDARSTLYCTDVAKMVQAPVLHVNGDDPEAVIFATQIAFTFRMKFKRDIVIDLVCYRRHGHNEADEPSVTQPLMYKKIKARAPLREIYAEQLIAQQLIMTPEVNKLSDEYRNLLDQGQVVVSTVHEDYPGKITVDWSLYYNAKWTEVVETSISRKTLQELSKKLQILPDNFLLHPVVKRLQIERAQMTSEEIPINWGYAEIMAYASLLQEGYSVRLSGQDSGRGTFAHRHAVFHDQQTGETFTPLEHIVPDTKNIFVVIDSILSEEAVLAFEYGYAVSEPTSLVLWEAQFGDFANGAQVVIDQFISSGEQKWGRLCGLVMLLPHGYEGQGPEHSSARLERYMQLCAQHNIQVCIPTTPAQMFHLLRRQMLRKFRKPLIIMTPKSLLRHKLAVSAVDDLVHGKFDCVIDEIDMLDYEKITKVILCCGKVYYDLLQKRRHDGLDNIAILRIEQLYPFPKEMLCKKLQQFPRAKQIVWCQEEPQNQGVWFAAQSKIRNCLEPRHTLHYVGREFAAAPAVGSILLHNKQQAKLVADALREQLANNNIADD